MHGTWYRGRSIQYTHLILLLYNKWKFCLDWLHCSLRTVVRAGTFILKAMKGSPVKERLIGPGVSNLTWRLCLAFQVLANSSNSAFGNRFLLVYLLVVIRENRMPPLFFNCTLSRLNYSKMQCSECGRGLVLSTQRMLYSDDWIEIW